MKSFQHGGNHNGNLNWTGKKEGDDILFYGLDADDDYARTFQLELKDGRFFSSEYSTDSSAIVINEKAARSLALMILLGKQLQLRVDHKYNIIGVVKDFHFKSLHHKIGPLIMRIGPSNFSLSR